MAICLNKRIDAGECYPDYFAWLCEMVCIDGRYTDQGYWRLAKELFDIHYFAVDRMDENRAVDGEDLRERYYDIGGEEGYEGPVTVLEVMVALACRIENIMDELDGENRVTLYFWDMIENLGLSDYSDFTFDEHPELRDRYISEIDEIVRCWLMRDISYSGKGSPFPLQKPTRDQRHVELWYQACAYLEENYT